MITSIIMFILACGSFMQSIWLYRLTRRVEKLERRK